MMISVEKVREMLVERLCEHKRDLTIRGEHSLFYVEKQSLIDVTKGYLTDLEFLEKKERENGKLLKKA